MKEVRLPSGWKVETLGKLSSAIQYGYTAKAQPEPVGPRLLRITDIQNDTVRWDEVPFCKIEREDKPRYLLGPNDIVFARTGATVGKSYLIRDPVPDSVFASYLIRVRLTGEVIPKYVAYFFKSTAYWRQITESQAGIGQPNVNGTKLAQIEIPVAPAGEQQLIVSEIEKQFSRLDEAVASLKRTKANLKRYKAAVLKAAVEGKLTEDWRKEHPDVEPASNLLERILAERRAMWKGRGEYKAPTEPGTDNLPPLPGPWTWSRLEQLTSAVRVICYGILMPKEHAPDGVLYVKVKDMKGDRVDVASLQRTSPKIAAAYARASLKKSDLLLAIRGTYGRVAEVPQELEGGNITQDTARLDVTPLVDRRYVAAHIRSEVSQAFFRYVARGVAVKGVNIGDVRLTPIALPPLDEQKQIVAEVERRLSVIEELEAAVDVNLTRADRLRQSVLSRAFAGKLVPLAGGGPISERQDLPAAAKSSAV